MFEEEFNNEINEVEKQEETALPTTVDEEVIDKPGGKVLNVFSKLFFVLTIIGTILTGVMVFLPIFLAILGVVSTIAWLALIIFVSIFTIGLIWTSEDFKSFNTGWMSFNSTLFSSSNTITEFALKVIPSVLVSGGVIIALCWLFTILGRCLDKFRKRKYKGRIIGLSIITVIYIAFLTLNIIIHNS